MNRVSESVDAGATGASCVSGTNTSTSRESSSPRSAVTSSSSRSCSRTSASSADSSITPRSSASSMKVWTGVGNVVVLRFFNSFLHFEVTGAKQPSRGATLLQTPPYGTLFLRTASCLTQTSEPAVAAARTRPKQTIPSPGAPDRRPLRGSLLRPPERRAAGVDEAADAEGGRLGAGSRRRRRLQAAQLDDAADGHRGQRRLAGRPQARRQDGGSPRDPPARGAERRESRDG